MTVSVSGWPTSPERTAQEAAPIAISKTLGLSPPSVNPLPARSGAGAPDVAYAGIKLAAVATQTAIRSLATATPEPLATRRRRLKRLLC
jgi:hypothetical protein